MSPPYHPPPRSGPPLPLPTRRRGSRQGADPACVEKASRCCWPCPRGVESPCGESWHARPP
eukprot:1101972-Pleurochrysis_carterae.AAC.1